MPPVDPGLAVRPVHSAPNRTWLVIFTDLVSLMLTFFVLLFSMSNVQVDRWEQMIDALSQTLNPSRERPETMVTSQYNIASLFRRRAVNLDYLASVLTDTAAGDPVLRGGQLTRLEDQLVIGLPGDLLFGPGRAELSERGQQAIFVLGGVLRNVGNQIGVNGHSDPRPPHAGTYESNWELTLARAVTVANALRQVGYREEIIAYGYADSRFSELPPIPEEMRLALGRRVDIVVLPTVGGQW